MFDKTRISIATGLAALAIANPAAAADTLDASQRQLNVRGAFSVNGHIVGSVLLVDDVITSGETVRAAARALLEAGAHRVVAIALGRTPRAVI